MIDPKKEIELNELILRELDGSCTDEQFATLEKYLSDNPEFVEYYVNAVITNAILREPKSVGQAGPDRDSARRPAELAEYEMDSQLWQALAENEMVAEAVNVEEEPHEEPQPNFRFSQKRKVATRRRQISKLAIYTSIVSTAALLFLLVLVMFTPAEPQIVARITDSIDAKWQDVGDAIVDDFLYESYLLNLTEGFVQIKLNSDAQVLLHAPAQFELEGKNQLFLHYGKLTSVVPPSAVGFTVRSSTATVVDYGTEFAVEVGDHGETEAHVFKGEVDLRVGPNTRVFKLSKRLKAGQASMVNDKGKIIVRSLSPSRYVRKLNDLRYAGKMLEKNLIVNGDFEKGSVAQYHPADNTLTNIDIYGWEDDSEAVIISYDKTSDYGYPNPQTDVVPTDRGNNFFTGIESCAITQQIDIDQLAYLVDSRNVRYELTGWLGAFGQEQDDSVDVIATFLDEDDRQIAAGQIGPITLDDRNRRTGFVELMDKGAVPVGTRKVVITVNSYHVNGDLADAYADNLRLVLSSK